MCETTIEGNSNEFFDNNKKSGRDASGKHTFTRVDPGGRVVPMRSAVHVSPEAAKEAGRDAKRRAITTVA